MILSCLAYPCLSFENIDVVFLMYSINNTVFCLDFNVCMFFASVLLLAQSVSVFAFKDSVIIYGSLNTLLTYDIKFLQVPQAKKSHLFFDL